MKIRKKIILGIISLMLLAVTFTSTTYAWFKLNSHAGVDFEFKVNGGLGFLVSVDNENFSNSLSEEQLMMSYYHKLNPNTTWNNGKLYEESDEVTEENLINAFSSIELYPVTSLNGKDFKDLYSSTFSVNSKRFLEFDVYFRATSLQSSDNFTYNIYLSLSDQIDDRTGEIIPNTRSTITSQTAYVELRTDMITWKESSLTENPGFVKVDSSNALRLSALRYDIESSIDEETQEEIKNYNPQDTATIIELSNQNDLGSYATDYNKNEALTIDNLSELDKLYNSNFNAMYTYYNKRRPTSSLESRLLKYEEKPNSLRDTNQIENTILTTVQSGGNSQKLTFRIWQEGWDADCFDGLAESINVRLSFHAILANDN